MPQRQPTGKLLWSIRSFGFMVFSRMDSLFWFVAAPTTATTTGAGIIMRYYDLHKRPTVRAALPSWFKPPTFRLLRPRPRIWHVENHLRLRFARGNRSTCDSCAIDRLFREGDLRDSVCLYTLVNFQFRKIWHCSSWKVLSRRQQVSTEMKCAWFALRWSM